MRVFELAKKLKMTSKELTILLSEKLQVKVSSHMAKLDEASIKKIQALAKSDAKPPAAKSKPKEIAKAPAVKKPTAAKKPVVSKTKTVESLAKPSAKPAAKPAPPVQKKPTPAVPVSSQPSKVAPVPPPVSKKPAQAPAPVAAKQKQAAESVAVAEAPPQLKPLSLNVPITVKELAEKLSVSPSAVIKNLLGMRILATINQLVADKTVEKVLKLYGYEYKPLPTLEEQIEASHVEREDSSKLIPRPAVVTFMGHVDHGKTSLLDSIRESRVIEGEAGGITQHIGAYRVSLPKGDITFLDTPGHEAFTAMRARGANATDIVVLVIAADDGIMPQTVEALNHAKAAEATIVIALNKMDKVGVDAEKVKRQLTEHELTPEEWGGKTIVVNVSAKTGQGIDHLLEMILLETELLELRANPNKPARGVVLEGKLTKGGGPIAHVLVQSGTLRVGDVLVSGSTWGKVRAILDVRNHRHTDAGPSSPVEILGMNGVPSAGDSFMVVPDEKQAREVVDRRVEKTQSTQEAPARRTMSLEEFHHQLEEGKVKTLNLILKVDVQGSAEAVRGALEKVTSEEASLKFLHVGVGEVSGSDVLLAEASNAVVIGFHVGKTPEADQLAKVEQVDVRLYDIIYRLVSDIHAALEGLLDPQRVEEVIGKVKVLQVFQLTKSGKVAGCQVLKGKVVRGALGRVHRGKEKVHEGKITSLKRFKDDAKEVAEGFQCGVGFSDWSDFEPDDFIEVIDVQQVAAKL